MTFDLMVLPRKYVHLHFGFEATLIAGLDVGPSLLIDSGRAYPGFSLIGWAGLLVYPFYELDFFPGRSSTPKNLLGIYAKLPLLPSNSDWPYLDE